MSSPAKEQKAKASDQKEPAQKQQKEKKEKKVDAKPAAETKKEVQPLPDFVNHRIKVLEEYLKSNPPIPQSKYLNV
jgi:hypothetical protein